MKYSAVVIILLVASSVSEAFLPPTMRSFGCPQGLFETGRDESVGDSSAAQTNTEQSPYLLFPGGGIFFYWQAGVVSHLREQGYDLNDVKLGGASAGALTATLTATNVDFYQATDLALSLAKDAGVWDRTGGLQGIWGPMIETWLDELLPMDAVEKVNDRLSLLVTRIPTFQRSRIQNYESRKDLIACNMASVHLPWFLDGKLTSSFRNAPHIDGSFLCKLSDFDVTESDKVIMPSYHKDPNMELDYLDFIKTVTPDTIYGFLDKGKAYAKVMEEQGKFQLLKKHQVY